MMSAVFQIRYIFVSKLLLFVTNCFCNKFCKRSRLIFMFLVSRKNWVQNTAWKVSKYGVLSGPYFTTFGLFSPNAGKYGPEKAPYLDTFHSAKVHNCYHTPIKNMTLSHRSKSAQAIHQQNWMFVNRFYNFLNVIRRTMAFSYICA